MEEKTYEEAKESCKNLGARLCTLEEIEEECILNGNCRFNDKLIWSSKKFEKTLPPIVSDEKFLPSKFKLLLFFIFFEFESFF